MPLSKDGMAPFLDEAVEAGITVMEMGNVSNAELVKAACSPIRSLLARC